MVNGKTFAAGEWEAHLNALAESVRAMETQIVALAQQVEDLTAQVGGETALREMIDRARTHVTAAAEALTE